MEKAIQTERAMRVGGSYKNRESYKGGEAMRVERAIRVGEL
jgi:hypothetical protein